MDIDVLEIIIVLKRVLVENLIYDYKRKLRKVKRNMKVFIIYDIWKDIRFEKYLIDLY